jgi:hypothetical protein
MAFSLALLGASTYEAPAVGSYDLLATEILTSSQSSITFASLGDYAADYQHLQIRVLARTTRTSNTDDVFAISFNGNTTMANYSHHFLKGNGSSVSSTGTNWADSSNGIPIGHTTSSIAVASNYAPTIIDILDAFSSSKNTTVRSLSGWIDPNSNAGYAQQSIQLSSGAFLNTSSITSISLGPTLSPNFVTGSRFSLYGLRKV